MGSETREIVMAFSREFGETESPPRLGYENGKMFGGGGLKGPLFLFELQSEVVMRNRLVLLAALDVVSVRCRGSGSGDGYCAVSFERAGAG